MLSKNIALIGFMGSGKSTVGALLADSLGATFVDSDKEIEKATGMTIADIFEKFGETHFRKLETATIKNLCAMPNMVISTGGGVVLNTENTEALRQSCVVIFLDVCADEIAERLKNDTSRPLLGGNDKLTLISERLKTRMPLYINTADIIISCDNATPEENCLKIINLIQNI